jgi:hypothetical protein
MKTPLIAILASLLLLPAALLAAGYAAKDNPAPKAAPQSTPDIHSQIAAFNARVEYAKAHGEAATCANAGGPLSCTVYTVKQGADGAPGYTLIIAKNTADAPEGDITVLCDTVAIDPAHSIKCTGGIVATRGGVLTVGEDESTVLQLGLGQGDAPFTVTGASRMSKIN